MGPTAGGEEDGHQAVPGAAGQPDGLQHSAVGRRSPATSTAVALATSTAVVAAPAAPASLAWDEGIDEEVERLLRAEIGNPAPNVPPVPPPKSQPKLGSSLLFKLPGGVTGEVGKQLVRAKGL